LAAEGTEDAAALDRVAAAVASVVVAPQDVARDGLGEALDAAEAAGAVVARVERFPAIAAAGVAAQTGGAARDAVVPVRAAERVSGAVLGCGEEGGVRRWGGGEGGRQVEGVRSRAGTREAIENAAAR
jgi:hypothetical protein